MDLETLASIASEHLKTLNSELDHPTEADESDVTSGDALDGLYATLVNLDSVLRSQESAAREHKAKLAELADLATLQADADSSKARWEETRAKAAPQGNASFDLVSTRLQAIYSARLDFLKLSSSLKRQEKLLRAKEEVSSGLNLIEYEQLKVENQSLAQKLEQREKDLLVANTKRLSNEERTFTFQLLPEL